MSNIKENIVLSEQSSACADLKRELEELLKNLKHGIMPEEDTIFEKEKRL